MYLGLFYRSLLAWMLITTFVVASSSLSVAGDLEVPRDAQPANLSYSTSEAIPTIYWVDFLADTIQSARIDGSEFENVVYTGFGASYFLRLDVANNYMYWTEAIDNVVYRSRLNGAERESLFATGNSSFSDPYGFDIDTNAGVIYWADAGYSLGIKRSGLDGNNKQTLVTAGLAFPWDLHLDLPNGKMYWCDLTYGQILRADTSGANVDTLVSGLSTPYDFDIDTQAGKLYWVDNAINVLESANLDGSGRKIVVTGEPGCLRGLAVHESEGKIYFTHCESIYRVDTDGKHLEVLPITGLDIPWGVALEIGEVVVAVDPSLPRLGGLRFGAPRPLPATEQVRLDLTLASATWITVDVFDVKGRRVANLVNGELPAGIHTVVWDGRNTFGSRVASGIYHLRASGAGERATQSVVMVR